MPEASIRRPKNHGGERVLIIRNAQPYDFGGGERIPVQLAVEIAKSNFEPIVVSRSLKLLEYADSKGVPTVRGWWWSQQHWSGARILLLPVYAGWQLILTGWYIRLIRKTDATVVHPQSKDDFIAATIAGRLLGKRVVWSDYADLKYLYLNHGVWFKNPIGKFIYWLSRWASAVILTSHSDESFIKTALGKDVLPKQYVVVYNGVTDRPVKPQERSADDKKAFVFCATSRLVTAKGIGELVEAFAKLNRLHADTRLWLAGDGPEGERFKKQAEGCQAITFLGHVTAPLPLVAASDVFVHPSYLEGFSISLLEAAMLGKPIVACDVGGNPEIIVDRQTGLLVKDKNAQELYEALLELYNDRSLARQLGQNARARFVKDFQFEKIIAEQFIPLYDTRKNTHETE